MAVQSSVITRDLDKIAAQTGNVYESVVIISKRARQIAVNIKEELNNKLAEFATTVDNLEEVFENREQIEISKFYERLPKPTTTATEEFLELSPGNSLSRNKSPDFIVLHHNTSLNPFTVLTVYTIFAGLCGKYQDQSALS